MPRLIDLFCGAGYGSYGMQQAGFTVDGGYDNWSIHRDR